MKRYLSRLNRILPQLRWMAGYSHRYRWVVFWHILLGLLGTAIGLAASVVGKTIIDTVTGYQTGEAVTIALWYVSLQLIKILLSAVTSYINERIHIRVSQQLRGEIFALSTPGGRRFPNITPVTCLQEYPGIQEQWPVV